MTIWRLRAVSAFLRGSYASGCLEPEESLLTRALDLSVRRMGQDPVQKKAQLETIENALVLPLRAELLSELADRSLEPVTVEPESLERCVRRLRNSFPISAQGSPKQRVEFLRTMK